MYLLDIDLVGNSVTPSVGESPTIPYLPDLALRWHIAPLLASCAVGVVLIIVGLRVFAHREDSFGDQL